MKRQWFGILCVGALALSVSACTPPEEKIKRVFERGIEDCKKAKGEWAKITYLKDSHTMVLKEACNTFELGKVEMSNKGLVGSAKMGPYEWTAGEDDALDIWVLTNVEWVELERVRRARANEDATKEDLQKSVADFDAALKGMPDSWWIRRERLANALDLRAKSRKGGDPDVTIGPVAQAVFDDSLTWAKSKNNPSYVAGMQLQVLAHLKKYDNKLEIAQDSMGSGDDVLEKLIAEAQKTKNKVDEQKYTKELEERQAQRSKDEVFLDKKRKDLKALICTELSKVSATGVTDEAVSKEIVAAKAATKCS